MQELSMSFHTNFESGRLQTKVLRDAESVEILSRQLVNVVFLGIINVLFALIATILKNWIIALFFLFMIPLAIFLTRFFQKKMALSNQEYRNQLENMSARVGEMVQMLPITRAHDVEEHEINYMERHLTHVKEKGMKLDILNAVFGASSWVSFQLFQFICLMVTAFMAYHAYIKVGDVIMYQGFFTMIINSVNMIINILPEVNRGFDAIGSLGEILECPDIEFNEGKRKMKEVKGHFLFDHITFSYEKEIPALFDFTLEVKQGECIAIVGESGSGKSTLMNLIIGYRRPQKGKIMLDYENTNDIDLRTYRRFLAVVPQHVVLFSGSIRENILYGLEKDYISDKKLKDVLTMCKLNDVIDQLPEGLETIIGEHGDKLSGGQKQRIAIARALIRNPRVIIFDEATAALDVESEKYIQDSIDEMIKGRTTFIVAHRLSTIRKADRIIVLHQGKIAESGTHSALLDLGGIYSRMVSVQIR